MRKILGLLLLLGIGLTLGGEARGTPGPAGPALITSAAADASLLTVSGSNFGTGPTVTLGGTSLVVTSSSSSQIKATLLSIEGVTSRSIDGVLAAPSVGGGCREDAAFSGVFDF